jgi:hypothetical protein
MRSVTVGRLVPSAAATNSFGEALSIGFVTEIAFRSEARFEVHASIPFPFPESGGVRPSW